MKQILLTLLVAILAIASPSMAKAATTIEGTNDDGKVIYYEILSESDKTVTVTAGSEDYNGNLVIPKEISYNNSTYTVKEIKSEAFKGKTKLDSITIPNSITSIGNYSFQGCEGLKKVTFSNGSYNLYIGYGATNGDRCGLFEDCPLIEAFIGRPTTYSSSYTEYRRPFRNNKTLKQVEYGEYVTIIEKYSFYGCNSLDTIIYPDECNIEEIGEYAFAGCSSIESVTILPCMKTINNYVYMGCTNIKKVTIEPTSYNLYIGYGATNGDKCGLFEDSPITEVYFGRPTTYSSSYPEYRHPFRNNKDLEKVEFGEFVTNIPSYSFYGCSKLFTISYPDNNAITEIGNYAFANCTSLESVTIPASVKTINNYVYMGCTNLQSVDFEDSSTNLYVGYGATNGDKCGLFEDCPITKAYIGRPMTYSSSYPEYRHPFRNNQTIKTIEYGKDVTNIGKYSFYGCKSLDTIIYPNECNIEEIGEAAFANCIALKSFTFPSSVTTINNYVFMGCTGITKVDFLDGSTNLYIGYGATNGAKYGLFEDCPVEEAYIGRPTTYSSSYSDYKPFRGNKNLKQVTFGDNVTTIYAYSFYECSNLTTVNMGNSIENINNYAFYGCTSLSEMPISDSLTNIYIYAFANCSGLKSIVFPPSVEVLGDYAFESCTNVTSIVFEEGNNDLTTIGCGASKGKDYGLFYDCPATYVEKGRSFGTYSISPFDSNSNIKEVVIKGNQFNVGSKLFYNCTGIESVTLEEGVEEIGQYAFYNASIKEIVFPSSITKIWDNAFTGNTSIEKVTSCNTIPPTLVESAFEDTVYKTATLYVPEESIELYRTADAWKNFITINEINGISSVFADEDGETIIYRLNGMRVNSDVKSLTPGFYIINGKKVFVK